MIAAISIELPRFWLRRQRYWLKPQDVRRGGLGRVWRQRFIQQLILLPTHQTTRPGGPVEIHSLGRPGASR